MNPRNRLALAFPWKREEVAVADQPRSPAYRVGEPFMPGRTSWPEGAQYGFGPLGHELTLFHCEISPRLMDDARRGEAEFALIVNGPILFLAYRFGHSIGWSDVPYSWHLQHRDARATPRSFDAPEGRALLWISLVGADDGVVHAQRGLTLNPRFTRALHKAIRDQAASPFDPLDCALSMAEASRGPANASHRLSRATAWTQGNA